MSWPEDENHWIGLNQIGCISVDYVWLDKYPEVVL